MQCPKCGMTIRETDHLCPGCGILREVATTRFKPQFKYSWTQYAGVLIGILLAVYLLTRTFSPSMAKHGEYDQGFKGAFWGSTSEQVRQMFIGVVEAELTPEQGPGWNNDYHLSDYTPSKIVRTAIVSGNDHTIYSYFFWNDHLTEVRIMLPAYFSDAEVRRQIESQYGSPQEEKKGDGFYFGDEMRWQNENVTIYLQGPAIRVIHNIRLRLSSSKWLAAAKASQAQIESMERREREDKERSEKGKVVY